MVSSNCKDTCKGPQGSRRRQVREGSKRYSGKSRGVSERARIHQLLNERNPKLAYDIAIKFNLPEQYIKHAKVEELRLKAKDIEDVSYKFIENAQELRLQADEIELSMSPDWVVCDKKVHKQIQSERKEVEKDGKPIVACDLDSGYFFRAQEAAKKEIGKDVYYKIGLLVFENELSIGNDKYAELIASSYKIKEEDKRIITEAVKSRKVNNNTNA